METGIRFRLLLAISLFFPLLGHTGTCTTISRPNGNYVSNQILTASDLNNDLNTIYAPFNSASGAADGGCIADGTLENGALNTTDFDFLNSIKSGCSVSAADANTIQVDDCRLYVSNQAVKTTSATSATWGCTDCSAEAANTTYYVYARTTSSGSTLNLLISTTAPNGDGFDDSGNRALGSFYNNASSSITSTYVRSWETTGLREEKKKFRINGTCSSSSSISDHSLQGTPTIGNISGGACVITIPSGNITAIADVVCTANLANDTYTFIDFQYTSATSITIRGGTYLGAADTEYTFRVRCEEMP